jgi:hypothetical protein
MLRRLAPFAVVLHPLVHVATFGLDDLLILIIVGVYACLISR